MDVETGSSLNISYKIQVAASLIDLGSVEAVVDLYFLDAIQKIVAKWKAEEENKAEEADSSDKPSAEESASGESGSNSGKDHAQQESESGGSGDL